MPMVWQDWTSLNKKYNDAWLAGLGEAGVFDQGSVLTPRRSGVGQTAEEDFANIVWWGQVWTNQELEALNLQLIEADGVVRPEFCGALAYLVDMAMSGAISLSVELTDWAGEYGSQVEAACVGSALPAPLTASGAPATTVQVTQQAPATVTTLTSGPSEPPVVTTTTTPTEPVTTPGGATAMVSACTASGCECYVYEGDSGPHIQNLQTQINAALDAAGYLPIEVTGVYDKATCGAIFTLGGSFDPEYPAICTNVEGEWVVPLQCHDMVLPKKPTEAGGPSRASMFAVGGLLLAAGLGAAYWMSKR